MSTQDEVVELAGASVRLSEGTTILHPISFSIERGDHWVVLGPNGSGKSTLMSVLSMYQHPSTGSVTAFGERLGRTDVRRLRGRVGLVSSTMLAQLRPGLSAHDVVVTAVHGALEPWWHTYDDADHRRADELLDFVGCGGHAQQAFGTLSAGERQRTMLARALMAEPELLLLDEPAAGLDLSGRESLVATMRDIVADPASPTVVLVTHHVEEVPPGFTHVMMLREGHVVSSGPIASTMTEHALSTTFELDVELEHRAGRWTARARL